MTKEKKELKTEETQTGDDVQPVKTQEEVEIETLRKENERLVSDNVNYKQAITNKQADEFKLEDEQEPTPKPTELPTNTVEDDDKAWDQVRKEAQEIASQTYTVETKKQALANEKVAKKQLFADNPELASDNAMLGGIREYYVNRHGKSVEGIKIDMDDAMKLYKVNNNIPLIVEEAKPIENIPNMPTGQTNNTTETDTKLSSSLEDVRATFNRDYEQDLSEESFLRYQKAVLSGERSAPQEVLNLFKNSV